MTEAPVGKLTENQLDFVTLVHQHHALTSELMSQELATERYGVRPKDYKRWMGQPLVRNALKERGLVFERFDELSERDTWKAKALTPLQLIVANTMLDVIDTRSEKKKLQDLNVSTQTYQAWLRDPVFQNYVRSRAESMLGDVQHDAHLALIDKVRSGDVNAIKYLNEINGRFVPASNRSSGTTAIGDVQVLLTNILEIILDEVDDPAVAARIADRFGKLTAARTMAGELTGTLGEPAPLPEIMPNREMTPNMQKLLDSGEGVNI